MHSIVVDPDDSQRLYPARTRRDGHIDGGRKWMTEETGFGPAVTMWLSLIRTPAGQKQLFAFTHGRGAWRVPSLLDQLAEILGLAIADAVDVP